ncbi:MAG: hypothetical protein V2A79_00315 [Planctomycetota bacterium]
MALLLRQLAAELPPAERLQLIFDLTDVLLKFHMAVLSCVLAQFEVQGVHEAFRQVKPDCTHDLRLTLGHWLALGRAARGLLQRALENNAKQELGLRRFASMIVTENVEKGASVIVKARNQYSGHSYTLSQGGYEEVSSELKPVIDRLVAALSYLSTGMWFFLESTQRQRRVLTHHIRPLVNDNPEITRTKIERPRPHPFESLQDREVYFEYDTDRVISLHPWIVFHPDPRTHREVVWLLDGAQIKSGRVLYKSPQTPGESLELAETFPDFWKFFGG